MTTNTTPTLQAARMDVAPRSDLHDTLCGRLILMGCLDADALNAL